MSNEKVDFKKFYEKYKQLVFNLALNYSANKEDAEEIAHIQFIFGIGKNKQTTYKRYNGDIY